MEDLTLESSRRFSDCIESLHKVRTGSQYHGWCTTFLACFEYAIEESHLEKAVERYALLSKRRKKLVNTTYHIRNLFNKKELTRKFTSEAAQKCLQKLNSSIRQVIYEMDAFLPASERLEKAYGYTSRDAVAILIRDTFSEYARLSQCTELLGKCRKRLAFVASHDCLDHMIVFQAKFAEFHQVLCDMGFQSILNKSVEVGAYEVYSNWSKPTNEVFFAIPEDEDSETSELSEDSYLDQQEDDLVSALGNSRIPRHISSGSSNDFWLCPDVESVQSSLDSMSLDDIISSSPRGGDQGKRMARGKKISLKDSQNLSDLISCASSPRRKHCSGKSITHRGGSSKSSNRRRTSNKTPTRHDSMTSIGTATTAAMTDYTNSGLSSSFSNGSLASFASKSPFASPNRPSLERNESSSSRSSKSSSRERRTSNSCWNERAHPGAMTPLVEVSDYSSDASDVSSSCRNHKAKALSNDLASQRPSQSSASVNGTVNPYSSSKDEDAETDDRTLVSPYPRLTSSSILKRADFFEKEFFSKPKESPVLVEKPGFKKLASRETIAVVDLFGSK